MTLPIRTPYLLTIVALAASASICAKAPSRGLSFATGAEHFTESCPLGNGRIGAMVFGRVVDERIVLNESGMWSGSPQDADRRNAADALPEIRRLLLEGKNFEAEQLVERAFTCAGQGSGSGRGKGLPYGCYQTLGDLSIRFVHDDAPVVGYERRLDFTTAQATVQYSVGNVRFTRRAFVSKPDEAFVLWVGSDRPGTISFSANLTRPERATCTSHGQDELELHGQLEDGFGGESGVRYASRLRVIAAGGSTDATADRIEVTGADSALLLVTAATDIRSFAGRGVTDARAAAAQDMRRAAANSLRDLSERQLTDHLQLYDRVRLRLDASKAESGQRQPRSEADVARLFDYGRYLLISSSRAGGFPANLQGLWAEELQTPWNGDWHANVNVQMNYWPAEVCALSECHRPLFAMIESLVDPGRQTAKRYYNARGWVSHLLINPWGFTAPGESARWGSTPSLSAWLCWHLWDHYLHTGDRDFLERAYPTLRDAAAFYADLLVEEPSSGLLVTAPSNSPENAFIDDQGRTVHTCMGPAFDQQLLRFLFDAAGQSAVLLRKDEDRELMNEIAAKRERLAPMTIGDDGRINEWRRERTEADPKHRHVSHLWALYPGLTISRHTDASLAAAAQRSLEARGDGGTGWALANKACMWARLGHGDRALRLLETMLRPARDDKRWFGGVYPNLFASHPPFQIDGNFGATAAIAEMLLQSRYEIPDGKHPASLEVLPALPTAWASGKVRGLRARGGISVDLSWRGGRLTKLELRSEWAPAAEVRYGQRLVTVPLPKGESVAVTL